MRQNVETEALQTNPEIFITKPITYFKLLRNFGHMTRNLGINFIILNAKICAEIENYLSKYCSDSLERFSLICNRTKIPFDNLQKPFKKVVALKIHTILEQHRDHIQYLNETNYPNLQHLLIYNRGNLKNSEKIHYEYIEHFTFFGMWDKYPFSFGSLTHLTIANASMNDEFYEFLGNVKHLKTLKIMKLSCDRYWSSSKIFELQNVQSQVVEMSLQFYETMQTMSCDDIFRCLRQSQKMRKLSFHLWKFSRNEISRDVGRCLRLCQTVTAKLGANWTFHVIDPFINPFQTFMRHICFVIERIID